MKRHKWSDIKARAKPETRARIEAEAQRLSDDLHLSQLRKARGLTQETMAELLGVSQAEVSKMERRTELYVGTLRKFIEAMNGELVIAARFADGVRFRFVWQRKKTRPESASGYVPADRDRTADLATFWRDNLQVQLVVGRMCRGLSAKKPRKRSRLYC